jgi:hypothetical protein
MTPHANAPAAQRVQDAWALRVRGAGWKEIALVLGYANAQNAMRAVRNFAGRLPQPSAPELRSLWRERLEYLWPMAVRDVEKGRPGATRAAVSVAARAAQLDGLDAPQRVTVDFEDPEVQRALFAWLGVDSPQLVEADVLELETFDADEE